MSERGDALHEAMDDALVLNKTWAFDANGKVMVDMQAVARSICEHLGITWEALDALDEIISDARIMHSDRCVRREEYQQAEYAAVLADNCHEALETLLEAAGIER